MKINKKMIVGLFIILFLIAAAIFGPCLSTVDPANGELINRLKPPSVENFFGTDHLGRDVFTRLIYGARLSMGISFLVIGVSTILGTIFGLVSGYYRGFLDNIIMTIVEILLAFPSMVLSLAVVGIMGPGLKNAVFAVCLVSWIGYIRLVRGMVLSIKEKDFVKNAKICGSSDFKIITKHILPNVLNSIIIYSATNISSVMMQLAALSFLGLGVKPPISEWGGMLNDAKGYITTAPWLTIAPSMALIVMIVGFNLFGEGISEYLSNRKTGGD